MQLLLVSSNHHVSLTANAVRNVCNATLSLLFTASLLIWGLLVNRKQAWRTDGGTAVFGCAALSLALVSTALNFLYVHKADEFVWLPGLMWAVVLWQSFLGWWWWVGAGSGSGFATEDEHRAEKLRREAKRASRKREAREKMQGKRIKAQKVWHDVTAVFANNNIQPIDPSPSQMRSRTAFSEEPPYYENSQNPITPPSSDLQSDMLVASDSNSPALSKSTAESVLSQNSTTTSVLSSPRALPGVIYRWYLSLRHAHVTAARQQTAERVQRIQEFGQEVDRQNPWGWGWGGFGWRAKVGKTPSVGMHEKMDTVTKSEYEDEQDPQMVADWGTRMSDRGVMPADDELEGDYNNISNHQKSRTDHDCQDAGPNHRMPQQDVPLPPPVAAIRPSSMWWWGPLRRWRLQDSTVY